MTYQRNTTTTRHGYTNWEKLENLLMRHAASDGVGLTLSVAPECWRAVTEYDDVARVYEDLATEHRDTQTRRRARWYRLLADCSRLLLTVRDQHHVLRVTAERCRVAKLYR